MERKSAKSQDKLELRDASLSPRQLFSKMNGFRVGRRGPEIYSLFTFETLHNLHLGISEMLKECVFSYLSSDTSLTDVSKGRAEPKALVQIRNAILRGCSLLHSAFQRESATPVIEVDSSKGMHRTS